LWRGCIAVLAAAAAAAPLGARADERPKPHLITLDPAVATAPASDLCGPPARDPVPDGKPIVVVLPMRTGPSFTVGRIPSSWWHSPPSADPVWRLWFRGFEWLPQLAARAGQDGQKQSLRVLTDQIVAFHAQDPDPGTRTAAATANANRWGWDEGSTLRRLQAENCLYSLTKDARLVPGMKTDVGVQYGPRFYGPPLHPVHNHGLMADLGILDASELLRRPDWWNRSVSRLKAEVPIAFTPTGTSKEQSSGYHAFDVSLWFAVADTVAGARPGDPAAASFRALAKRGDRVTAWLTEPDGRLTVYGDASRDPGTTRSKWTARVFRDDAAGVVVGRWSWTRPTTAYYVIRYGPPRTMHGQQDRGGITWSDLGRRILVNPGHHTFDAAGNNAAYVMNPVGHNVAFPLGRTLDLRAQVRMTAVGIRGPWHQWTTGDALFGVAHVRHYAVGRDAHQLRVTDAFGPRTRRIRFEQVWHLDPAWRLVRSTGRTMVFKAGHRTLTMVTTGTATAVRGVSRPTSGWWYPDALHRVPAEQIVVRAAGSATTTFTIR